MKVILAIGFVMSFCCGFAQTDSLNRKDAGGRKIGYWKIYGDSKLINGYAIDDLVEEGKYDAGKKNGLWKTYYPGNKIKSEKEYKNNRPSGIFVLYFENGKIMEKGMWKGNGYVGTLLKYKETGCLLFETDYSEKGEMRSKKIYSEAADSCNVLIKHIKQDSLKYLNGDISNDKVNPDNYVKVNQNNTIQIIKDECSCNAMVTDSFHIIYNEKGKPRLEGEFRNNKLYTGKCYEYADTVWNKIFIYEKGLFKYFEFNFSCDEYDRGMSYNKLYNKDKQIVMDGQYKCGYIWNGKYYLYDKNGLLLRILIYKNGRYFGDGQLD